MGKQGHAALDALQLGDQRIDTRAHLLGGLAAGTAVAPEEPARPRLADLLGRDASYSP